jgi:hypothetical protein
MRLEEGRAKYLGLLCQRRTLAAKWSSGSPTSASGCVRGGGGRSSPGASSSSAVPATSNCISCVKRRMYKSSPVRHLIAPVTGPGGPCRRTYVDLQLLRKWSKSTKEIPCEPAPKSSKLREGPRRGEVGARPGLSFRGAKMRRSGTMALGALVLLCALGVARAYTSSPPPDVLLVQWGPSPEDHCSSRLCVGGTRAESLAWARQVL